MVVAVQVEPCMAAQVDPDRHPLDKLAQVVVVELDTLAAVVVKLAVLERTVDRAVVVEAEADMLPELEPI
jgi:hypothetical protein